MNPANRCVKRPGPRLVQPLDATQPPPPERPGEVGVLSTMTSGDHIHWLRVGVAHVEEGLHGDKILCVELGAIPTDRRMYIPLGDVLAAVTSQADSYQK